MRGGEKMEGIAPSVEQKQAIGFGEARFTVVASAGSGKTSVLVERYLRHVTELGHRPDEILTITFTRKAAAEMKRRIVGRLQELGRADDAQVAETGPIQTIHSFCERALRENALAAGMDPAFDVLSDSQSASLVESAVRWSLAEALEESEFAQEYVLRKAGVAARRGRGVIHEVIAKDISMILDRLRGSGHQPDDLADLYASPEALGERFRNEILRDTPTEVAESLATMAYEDLAQHVFATKRRIRWNAPKWVAATQPEDEAASMRITCGIMHLALASWRWLDREIDRTQRLDFAALESRCVRLIMTCPASRQRLRRQFKAVLVDEAQDLNPMQYALIDGLGIECEMLVGDPQQSIYLFRNANPELFERRSDVLASVQLSQNFRSEPGILRFIDLVFSGIWKGKYRPMAVSEQDGDDPFGPSGPPDCTGTELWISPSSKHDLAVVAKNVRLLVDEGWQPGQIAVLTEANERAQIVVENLSGLGVAARILGGASKFFVRMEVRDLANALEAVADPKRNFALLATLRGPFVGLSVDSTVLLAGEESVYAALAGFKPPIADDEARLASFLSWFEPLSQFADRLPAWEVLAGLMRDTPFLSALATRPNAEQALANVRKLFMIATEEPEESALTFAERIRYIEDLEHRIGDAPSLDDDANAVSVMTIHKAKGLEFDVVVLADGNSKILKTRVGIAIDAEPGLVATSAADRGGCMAEAWIRARAQSRDALERQRLMYVALTRARKRLCVVIPPSPNQETIGGLIAHQFANPSALPGATVRQADQGA